MAGFGSSVPAGGATVAVLTKSPVAVVANVAVKVKVTWPFTAKFRPVLMSPIPPVSAQLEPAVATHVQFPLPSADGNSSITVAPTTALGPALVTTIV